MRPAARTFTIPPQIAELHYDVNDISKELLEAGSPLFDMAGHPSPSSSAYWQREIELVRARKEGGAQVWQAWDDVGLIKQLLAECNLQFPRVAAFVHEVAEHAALSTKDRKVLRSCRIKVAKRCLSLRCCCCCCSSCSSQSQAECTGATNDYPAA